MTKVFSDGGKNLIFLSILGVLLVFSPVVSAQSKVGKKQSKFINSTNSTNLLRENGFDEKAVAEKINQSDDLPANEFAYHFRATGKRRRLFDFDNLTIESRKKQSFLRSAKDDKFPAASNDSSDDSSIEEGFQWKSAIKQSLLFLAVQHGYAIGFQAKTRRDLKHGAFFRDYARSVKSLHGWDDGGRFFTNYIAHPMQGALTGFIYVQNSPKERKLEFNESGYWRSRMKAFAWSAAWSTQFEIGPISQAAIGNVGLHGKQTWEDIVVTPTAGTAMLIGEDAIDRFITKRIERNTDNFYIKIFSRMILSPSRNFSNLLRFKQPWYRDRPEAK